MELLAGDWVVPLLTLTALEIVLGIDNLVFLSIVTARLPPAQRPVARRVGLILACVSRILLLLALAWLASLTATLFAVGGHEVSVRDLVLIAGGLFLIVKATMEVHHAVEGEGEDGEAPVAQGFWSAIATIAVIDIVFSLDSVITAVGMVRQVPVMVAAILIAVAVMLLAANHVAEFIERHPTIKMLALSFLLLVGMALIADGMHFHIPRGYLYFAMAFSAGVEALNLLARRNATIRAARRNRESSTASEP